jgi:hypothetical protein
MPNFPGKPVERADIERKFRGNVGKRFAPEPTAAILAALWTLEQTDDLRVLGKLSLPA